MRYAGLVCVLSAILIVLSALFALSGCSGSKNQGVGQADSIVAGSSGSLSCSSDKDCAVDMFCVENVCKTVEQLDVVCMPGQAC